MAVDASRGMLDAARAKRWPPSVRFVHGRIEDLAALGVTGPFDGILAAYRSSDGAKLWQFDAGTGRVHTFTRQPSRSELLVRGAVDPVFTGTLAADFAVASDTPDPATTNDTASATTAVYGPTIYADIILDAGRSILLVAERPESAAVGWSPSPDRFSGLRLVRVFEDAPR